MTGRSASLRLALYACFQTVKAYQLPAIPMRLWSHHKCSRRIVRRRMTSSSSSVDGSDEGKVIYTTAVIKVAYDGTYFRGWKATTKHSGSDGDDFDQYSDNDDNGDNNENERDKALRIQQLENRRQSRRSRVLQRKGGLYGAENRIRTVEDTIRSTLMKLYGDVNSNQIMIDGCSRTDAGVHAKSQIAQFWCIRDEDYTHALSSPSRPMSRDDTSNFRPLPFNSDLSKLVFVMNRMLPPDVRVLAASPLPKLFSSSMSSDTNDEVVPFHPTLHALGKTYAYRFAIGPMHDPLDVQYVWHLDGSSRRGVGMSGKRFNMERALAVANLFVNSNDANISMSNAIARDYGAFRAAFKGTDRGRIQSTVCKLWECRIVPERIEILPSWQQGATGRLDKATFESYTVVISGDRFLYKMVRNIVGTIIAVACGNVELEEVRIALDTGRWKDKVTRICAPARGLTLHRVYYPPDHKFQWQNG